MFILALLQKCKRQHKRNQIVYEIKIYKISLGKYTNIDCLTVLTGLREFKSEAHLTSGKVKENWRSIPHTLLEFVDLNIYLYFAGNLNLEYQGFLQWMEWAAFLIRPLFSILS